jgi:hypothetical protein
MSARTPTLVAALVATIATGGRAVGDPLTTTTPPPPPPASEAPVAEPPPTSAADVATAPRPGDESGRLDEVDPGDSASRRVGRVLLFVPKVLFNVAMTPVRGGLYLFERYQLDLRFKQIFFNDAYTIGLYPTASFETGFGLNAGARFVDRDLFGDREHLSILAGYGGIFREVARAQLRSGDRLGSHVQLELVGEYERRPQDAFYGIGNGDKQTVAPPMLVDPLTDATAVSTRFRQRLLRAAAIADVRPTGSFHAIASGALVDHQYGPGETGTSIDMVYDPRDLVGWGGSQYLYSELELRWDARKAADLWEPRPVLASGSLASVFAGRAFRQDGGVDYWRYGVDLQQFIHLGAGPRVLIGRLHGEGVSAARDQIPFADLPELGGASVLRGYPLDRFRDRVAAAGSIEYRWDLSRLFDAGLFVDAGRVYPSLADLSLDHLRMGYGVALEMHSERGFLLEGSVASSLEGGLYLNLSLSPVFDLDPRVRRR